MHLAVPIGKFWLNNCLITLPKSNFKMDPIIALVGVVILLGAYQVFFVKDLDKLDKTGQPMYKRKK